MEKNSAWQVKDFEITYTMKYQPYLAIYSLNLIYQ